MRLYLLRLPPLVLALLAACGGQEGAEPPARAPLGVGGAAGAVPEGSVLGSDGRAHAGTSADPVPIDIDFLGAWEFNESLEQPFPEHVLALEGKTVRIEGFMLPDVDFEHIREFHLVRSLWGCCFGAPPRINEIVRVSVPGTDGMDYTYNTLSVTGKLHVVHEVVDGIIEDLYRLQADDIQELGFDDPLAPEAFDPATGFQGVLPVQEY